MRRKGGEYSCSFCGKPRDAVRRLIAGPGGVYICNECVSLCNEIIAHDAHTPPAQQGDGTRRAARHRRIPWWRRLLGRKHQTLREARKRRSPELLRSQMSIG